MQCVFTSSEHTLHVAPFGRYAVQTWAHRALCSVCIHVCVGKMATTSFLINNPSREGLFLEHLPCDMSDSASVPGIFLELLILTSPKHFQSARLMCPSKRSTDRQCTKSITISDLLLCNVVKCALACRWDANAQMRTSGVPLLVFSLGAQPLTGRRCEHSKQKPGSLNRPLPRSRRQVVVAKRTVSVSAQWAHCGPRAAALQDMSSVSLCQYWPICMLSRSVQLRCDVWLFSTGNSLRVKRWRVILQGSEWEIIHAPGLQSSARFTYLNEKDTLPQSDKLEGFS